MLGQDRPEKNSAICLVRSGEIPSPRETSIDKPTICVMKSERGALVTIVHTTAANIWRMPARGLIEKHSTAGASRIDGKILQQHFVVALNLQIVWH